ncbi:hypothetical protein N9B38_02715 [bacterium]|nr:hypothetical protein [bacterium]
MSTKGEWDATGGGDAKRLSKWSGTTKTHSGLARPWPLVPRSPANELHHRERLSALENGILLRKSLGFHDRAARNSPSSTA